MGAKEEGFGESSLDFWLQMEENEELAKLLRESQNLLTPTEAKNLQKEYYSMTNIINMNEPHFIHDMYNEMELNSPFFTTTPPPPMTAEERNQFKFVFPKGHFMNELLYGPSLTE